MRYDELTQTLNQCGMKQAEFARLIGVTPRAVSLWLSGEREIPGPADAYLRLFQLLPESLRRIELARLKDGGTKMRDGMFGMTFQGQTGAGMGMLVFDGGNVYGTDSEGARYDGSYIYREEAERVEVVLKVTFPPNVNTVLGITNPYEWAIDVTAAFNPKLNSGAVDVKTSLGRAINAQFKYLRSLPDAA
jgi:hypothetical protein